MVPPPFEAIAKALLHWNSRILLFRSSSEMFVHCTGNDLRSVLECTRQNEASRNLRAAKVSRQRILKSTLWSHSLFFQSVGSMLPRPGAANLEDLML